MAVQMLWIRNGFVEKADLGDVGTISVNELLPFESGLVRIVSGAIGTEIKWSCHAPCHASLFAAAEMLSDFCGPFVLRCFYGGWFEQVIMDSVACRLRLADIVKLIDKPLPAVVLSQHLPIEPETLPPLLQRIWRAGEVDEDLAVDCVFDREQGTFIVHRVGRASVIARTFGTSPNSAPCVSFGRYASLINGSYFAALESGDVRYEHVLASIVFPNSVRRWVPYHRLVLPQGFGGRSNAVSVVTEISSVEIRPI